MCASSEARLCRAELIAGGGSVPRGTSQRSCDAGRPRCSPFEGSELNVRVERSAALPRGAHRGRFGGAEGYIAAKLRCREAALFTLRGFRAECARRAKRGF